MVLQIWNADIEYEKEGLKKLPIWIQLYNVALQFWTAEGLSYIASFVGKPLYADEMTESAKRISYAKICVEVDVATSLPYSVDLFTASGSTVSIAIRYPWRPVKCGTCCVFGHSECNQGVALPPKGSTEQFNVQNASKSKIWVVKLSGGDPDVAAPIPAQVVSIEPTGFLSAPSDVKLPCSNHFEVLDLTDGIITNTANKAVDSERIE